MAPVSHATRPAARRTRRPTALGPATRSRRARGAAAITLIYIRPEAGFETYLDVSLAEIARRYAPKVELKRMTAAEAGDLADWASPGSPAILVMRRGAVIGEAMGDALPVRELDQAVRRALEWPADR
jgi:hypothetical protein